MARKRTITKNHHRACELRLEPGVSDADIGREIGVSRQTISNWFKRDDVLALLEEKRAAIEAEMPTPKDKAVEWSELGHLARQALFNILSGRECWEGRNKDGDSYIYAAPPAVVHSAAKTVVAKLKPDLKAVEHGGSVKTGASAEEIAEALAARMGS